MLKEPVIPGVWWVEVPETGLKLLCGSPMDIIKHLIKLGHVARIYDGGPFRESGPNAILLSDIPVQNGHFWNLAEFPFLHMLYRQGMVIPGHPGNTGRMPLIIGSAERCNGVISYLQRGTYGLLSKKEMKKSGVAKADMDDLWALKLKFAGGSVKSPKELLEVVTVDEGPAEILGGTMIERRATNVFKISFDGESIEVDLNLPQGKDWIPTYTLPVRKIPKAEFSVTHIGEGNGWDAARPCMGSMVNFGRKHYLIDAGPGINHSLRQLGLKLSEVEALFITHIHDDHFAGLTGLLTALEKMTVYATRPVMATVRAKCGALLEKTPTQIDKMMDIRYLDEGEWNSIDGFDVRPVISPHPMETTIMTFRAKDGDGYKTYAHLADITSYSVLESFIGDDGISKDFYERVKAEYSIPADVKKVDVGGGLIHGLASDFSKDESKILILSHTEGAYAGGDGGKGITVRFGDTDVLIP